MFGAQSSGCSPIATAYENGWDTVKPVKPTGIAKSLAIGNPADGPYALDTVRRTGGAMARRRRRDRRRRPAARADRGCLRGDRRRRDRRDVAPAARGRAIDPAAETVLYNAGEGLKTLDAVSPHVGPGATIRASADAFTATGLA